ncbi:TatD DNase family protein [Anaerosphaera aminiphila DSM 21120]|uniref:TatD DNase family protein n=1 Tax=Anaerosphaera aminiphila DSM 21120 TaxID=1120995 RepID=A0A1M5TB10_9FIRM|nr:TatD family hydrolase [Anaerosphaera aminiphila]SHH47975.1 TatD DNase family protein [Anaerosphaera aminiphila DSM 21120]
MIDSHAHLDDKKFDYDRDTLITNLKQNGIDFVYNIGADLESSIASVELANKYSNIHAVVGVHPHEAKTYSNEVEEKLIELTKDKKVRAIGEIGLDFYYDNSPRDVQREVFKRQIILADAVKLPVVIHSRDASEETYDMIEWAKTNYSDMDILIHCFSQSVEMMRKYMKLDCYIALGGAVTFKNARVPKEVAREVDINRLLLETDSPYMTPVPFRGKRNEPMYIKYVAREIAQIRGMDEAELVSITDANTKRFYND